MIIRLPACLLVALSMSVSPRAAAADDVATSMFSFGGFGTLGLVHSDEAHADYVASAYQPVGAGYTRSVGVAVDSRIAGQVTATFSPRLSAVVQVIAEQNYDYSYRPHVEWANLKYQLTPDLSLRVGRTSLSTFLVSDSRKIGYANPWIRPPLELYSLVPITSNDGIDAIYRATVGTVTNTVQATAGRSNNKFPIPNDGGTEVVNSRDQLVVVDSLQRGFGTMRLTYGRAHVAIPQLLGLFDGFRQFGPQGDAVADRYDYRGRPVRFFGVSASYEPGDWFAMGEWGRVITHSLYGDRTGWYISGGYRVRQITPYVNYGKLRADNDPSDPGLTLTGLPAEAAAGAVELNAVLNNALAAHGPQTTISFGARWDLLRNVALKLQYDRIGLASGSQGTLTNLQPGFRPGSNFNVVSVTMDFVF